MKIIKTQGEYNVLSDDVVDILDKFEPNIYEVKFANKHVFLEIKEMNEDMPAKIYGSTNARVDKLFKAFQTRNRNVGALLSGDKGLGKSLCIRKIMQDAVKVHKLPVLVVSESIPGLIELLTRITQPYVLVLDEFEKTFIFDIENDEKTDVDDQTQFLSFLDGINSNVKCLTVVAVNELSKLSNYFLNRPGRFRYHFKFTTPSPEVAEEYLKDTLINKDPQLIEKILSNHVLLNFNFDVLTAIVEELNAGYGLEETLADINIRDEENTFFSVDVSFKDGRMGKFAAKNVYFNLSCDDDDVKRVVQITDAFNHSITVVIDVSKLAGNGIGILRGDSNCAKAYIGDEGALRTFRDVMSFYGIDVCNSKDEVLKALVVDTVTLTLENKSSPVDFRIF